jgi:CDGSH-type Zn-finger protein/truncated hemoglobin YjbI
MAKGADTADATPTGGQGRLAQVIATRGGKAAPEAPFVIEHREALIYMLCEAAELEHGIMCQYLFAAFSLKQDAGEGLTEDQVAAVTRWRRQVSRVAAQEMLHLALVHNLLSAVGGAPHMARPNLPQPADHYPAGVELALLPFGQQALEHFMFLERPEGMNLHDAAGLEAVARARPLMSERDIVPRGQDFATVGHLYRSIEAGIAHLAQQHGEKWLFVGPPRAQASPEHFHWPELVTVTDAASAQRAIDTILEQGEGPRGHWRNAHFGQFVEILDEYQQLTGADSSFDPVRPVIATNVRPAERDIEVPLITDPLTARVADLFNVAYEILLQIFERYFAHTEETDAQLKVLADATVTLMLRVIRPLGNLITTLPAGPEYPGRNAGPSFELFYESDFLMPHREAAWALLTERLGEAAWLCDALRVGRGAALAADLDPVLATLREVAQTLAAHLPAGSIQARDAQQAAPLADGERDGVLARAAELARRAPAAAQLPAPAAGLAGLFGLANSALAAAANPAASGTVPTTVLPRLVNSVLRPLADALARQPSAQSPAGGTSQAPAGQAPADEASAGQAPTGQPEQPVGELLWQAAESATRLRADSGAAASPAELAEATAALQDLAGQLSPAAEWPGRLARLRELQAGLPAQVQVATDGPYLVTNVPLRDYLGQPIPAPPQVALCRCGGSALKPFCDGTHARNGFSGAKDPKRVPDRRDRYPGQDVEILDNRGLCQHSGFCTDRLPAVFRAGQEPFVAPSGGRLDEIIRAVRDCPSGALSLALRGHEERDLVDTDNRPAGIEVTRDGPYRLTGGVTVVDAGGAPVPRNQGASAEHCALCRCGQSQNKPFCSGMHWYVDFRDPVPEPGREPTLFEWAGGLPALARWTRLLYEKHVPADPMLAPVFADLPPGHARDEAARIAEVFGGPDASSQDPGGPGQAAGVPAGGALTGEQQARWVALATLAADEAGLPADANFRAALAGYLEWGARTAAAGQPGPGQPGDGQQPGPGQPAEHPVPRWDWTAAGPPDTTAAAGPAADQPGQPDQPVQLPGPDEAVSFAAHIKPLFRERDRKSMSFVFDLWSADDVRAHAPDILSRLRDGSMPCDGAWPDEQVTVFQRWLDSGMQP